MKWLALLLLVLGLSGWFMANQLVRAGNVPQAGAQAPEFNLPDQSGQMRNLREFGGKWLVLYFYPKDDTPGCTKEACAFRDDWNQLSSLGAQVVGISVDDSASHDRFAKKHNLPFPLLADTDAVVAGQYGVVMDMMISKVAKRYTFLIDPQGKISKVYDKVDTSRHSAEIIADLKRATGKN